MLVVMSWLILWSPYCLHTGLKAKDAIVNAVRSMSGRVIRTTFTLFSCVAPIELVMIITGALNAGVIAQFLLDVISYMVVVPFYITLMYTLFYDVTGTERMDYVRKKKDIWSKNNRNRKRKRAKYSPTFRRGIWNSSILYQCSFPIWDTPSRSFCGF